MPVQPPAQIADLAPPPIPQPEPRLVLVAEVVVDSGPAPVGAYSVILSFDPMVVQVDSVDGGDPGPFAQLPFTDPGAYASGRVRFAAFQSGDEGPKGERVVARVTFKSLAKAESALTARIETLVDPEGNPVAGNAAVRPGKVGWVAP